MSRLKNRQKVADIIVSVLTEQFSVREALLKFPKTSFDRSIECAWHALVHYEADEDLRAKDIDFKEEQDEYLYFLSTLLKDGKDLPANFLKDYKDFHGKAPIYEDENSGFWAMFLRFFRFININR